MKKVFKELVFWTWCLPQTLLGFILRLITKAEKAQYEGSYMKNGRHELFINYYVWNIRGSISLGKYLLLSKNHSWDRQVIKHEYGHQIQSFILGPLYLLLGLQSIIWASCFQGYRKKHKVSYYEFWTEKWANKLGGVK